MEEKLSKKGNSKPVLVSSGIVLVLLGTGYLLSSRLQVPWIFLLSAIAAGLVFLYFGFTARSDGSKVAGTLFTGVSLALFILNIANSDAGLLGQIGTGLFAFGLCWALLAIVLDGVKSPTRLWPLIPAGVILPISILFILGKTSLLHFVLAGCLGLGISLILWGLMNRWFGMVIPGCILITAGPGIFYAWRSEIPTDGLTQTGTMLVWFAVGWVLIALASRFLFSQIIWWPLIPAGVLAFVGWGLALGGNTELAKSIIGNSGSIIVILVGLYLLLLRKDVHK